MSDNNEIEMPEVFKKNNFSILNVGLFVAGALMFAIVSVLVGIKSGFTYGWFSGLQYGVNAMREVAVLEISDKNLEIESREIDIVRLSEELAQKEITLNEINNASFGAVQLGHEDPNLPVITLVDNSCTQNSDCLLRFDSCTCSQKCVSRISSQKMISCAKDCGNFKDGNVSGLSCGCVSGVCVQPTMPLINNN